MKKSELLRITAKETLENVRLGRATVEMEFKYRHNGPFTLKAIRRYFSRYVKALRRDRIFLHTVEKQIPMPLKVKSSIFWYYLPISRKKLWCVGKTYYCQCCNHKICYESERANKAREYCSHCGQKLWWPNL